jgi:hypothetical protein
VGQVADAVGLAAAFSVPLVAYLYIHGFALACRASGQGKPARAQPRASGGVGPGGDDR